MHFGQKILEARQQRGMSQAQLARAVGTSQQQINRIETGEIKHSRILPRIADILGLVIAAQSEDFKPMPVPIMDWIPIFQADFSEDGETMILRSETPIGRRPAPNASTPGTYCFKAQGNGMFPAVRAGNTLIVAPAEPIAPGDIAIFMRTDNHFWLAEFVNYDREHWTVRVYGDQPREFTLERLQWPTRHRVQWVGK